MKGVWTLYIDQYGQRHGARTVKELCALLSRKSARKMYVDKKDGRIVHCGYVVGPYWLTAYRPVELPA